MYNPIAPPEYKSVYVDHKLDVIAQNARDRYDTNLEAKNQLDRSIGAMRVNPRDQRIVDAAKQNVKDFIGSANSFELIGPAVDAALTSTVSNKVLTDSLESYKRGQEEDLLKRTLAAKNMLYDFETVPKVDLTTGLIEKDPTTGQNIMVSKRDNHDTESQGIYPTYVQEKLPLDQQMTSLAAQINAESLDDGNGIISNAILNADVSKDQWNHWLKTQQGISSEKINAVVDSLISTLENTPAGDQMLKAYQEIIPTDDGLRLHTKEEAKKKLKDAFAAIAMKHEGITAEIFQSWEPRPEPRAAKADKVERPFVEDIIDVPLELSTEVLEQIDDINEEVAVNFGKAGEYVGTGNKLDNDRALAVFTAELGKAGGFGNVSKDFLESEEGANGFAKYILAGNFGDVNTLRNKNETDAVFVNRISKALQAPTPETNQIIDTPAARTFLAENFDQHLIKLNGDLVSMEVFAHAYGSLFTGDAGVIENMRKNLADADITFTKSGPNAGLFRVVMETKVNTGLNKKEVFYMQPTSNESFTKFFQTSRDIYNYNNTGTVGKAMIISEDPAQLQQYMPRDEKGNYMPVPKGAVLKQFNVIEKDSNGNLKRVTYRDVAVGSKSVTGRTDANGKFISGKKKSFDIAEQYSDLGVQAAINGGSKLRNILSNFYMTGQKRNKKTEEEEP